MNPYNEENELYEITKGHFFDEDVQKIINLFLYGIKTDTNAKSLLYIDESWYRSNFVKGIDHDYSGVDFTTSKAVEELPEIFPIKDTGDVILLNIKRNRAIKTYKKDIDRINYWPGRPVAIFPDGRTESFKNTIAEPYKDKKYDIIFVVPSISEVDLPEGVIRYSYQGTSLFNGDDYTAGCATQKFSESGVERIYNVVELLSDKGCAIFLEPTHNLSNRHIDVPSILKNKGVYLDSVFKLPNHSVTDYQLNDYYMEAIDDANFDDMTQWTEYPKPNIDMQLVVYTKQERELGYIAELAPYEECNYENDEIFSESEDDDEVTKETNQLRYDREYEYNQIALNELLSDPSSVPASMTVYQIDQILNLRSLFPYKSKLDRTNTKEKKTKEYWDMPDAYETPEKLEFNADFVIMDKFHSFNEHQALHISKFLSSDYSKYHLYKLHDLAIEINYDVQEFNKNNKNVVYFSIKSPFEILTTDLFELEDLVRNRFLDWELCQIVVDTNIVSVNYLLNILKNPIIQEKIIKTCQINMNGTKLNKDLIKFADIPAPDKKLQTEIIETIDMFHAVSTMIQNLSNTITTSPISSQEDKDKLLSIARFLNEITPAQDIRILAQQSESHELEFKATFSMDTKTGKKEKFMDENISKAICGLQNQSGGILLIGISDDNKIVGIDREIDECYKGSEDTFLRHIDQFLENNLTPLSAKDYYEYKIIPVDGVKILRFDIKRNIKEPTLARSKGSLKTYQRQMALTKELNPQEIIKFAQTFPSDS